MCKISIDTVRRANKRTIMQVGNRRTYSGETISKKSFDVSVSVMGKVYGQKISASQIKSSFSQAVSEYDIIKQ